MQDTGTRSVTSARCTQGVLPGIDDLDTRHQERRAFACGHNKAARQGHGGDQRVRQRHRCWRGVRAPHDICVRAGRRVIEGKPAGLCFFFLKVRCDVNVLALEEMNVHLENLTSLIGESTMYAMTQASNPQSHLRFPLTQLFSSGGHVRVLRALMAFGAPLSVAQLAADGGLSTRGTRFVLDSLVAQGMVSVLGQPRSQLYSVALHHPLADAVKVLFQHEHSRWESVHAALRQALASWPEVRSAWLYGSVARGEDGPSSDVDLLLVVNEQGIDASHRVRGAVQTLGDTLGLHFSAVLLTPEELAAMHKDERWWTDLMRDAKVLKGLSPSKEIARSARSAQPA